MDYNGLERYVAIVNNLMKIMHTTWGTTWAPHIIHIRNVFDDELFVYAMKIYICIQEISVLLLLIFLQNV